MSLTVPFALKRHGVVMEPDPEEPNEAQGVLNPASSRAPDGTLYLLPRLVAAGNVSRVGLAEVIVDDGVPVGVRRAGVVLKPDRGWERGEKHAGVEDPRVTWLADIGLYLMTYVAFGPLGPAPALAVSDDLLTWKRQGPLHFEYQDDLDTDLNMFPNKDVIYFPQPVPGPGGRPCYAALHRPMWDLGWIAPGAGTHLPAGVTDDRPGIWISYAPVSAVQQDISALGHLSGHRPVATSEYGFEVLKVGGGPPPIRIPEGWLLIHHGVSGVIDNAFEQQQNAHYAAGAMILSADDPSQVIARTAEPLLSPETEDERIGTVPNVIFPTAIEEIDGRQFVFYGMADFKIGVAELIRTRDPS